MPTDIVKNLHEVQENIAAAQGRSDRAAKRVLLVAVTKNHDVAAMRAAIDAGVTDIGENRIQEAKAKRGILDRAVRWHLIGHLQTNKVKQAVAYFDLIHSIDSIHLAEAVDKAAAAQGKVQEILLQVNLAKEDTKSGVYEEDLPSLVADVERRKNLRLRGLMCIAPNYDEVETCRPLFRRMKELFQELKEQVGERIAYLSMGMTHDYPIAVEEGANILRVGTAIFGQRDYSRG